MRVATADGLGSALARLAGGKAAAKLGKTALTGVIPPYSIPNLRIESVPAVLPFAAGYMRGSPQREFAFFTESFIDELGRAAGMEPLAFRMSMLGGDARLARCLRVRHGSRNGTAAGAEARWELRGALPSVAHRLGRDGEHRQRATRKGSAPGCRRRLRARRQSGTGQAADRSGADLGARPGDHPIPRMGQWIAACTAFGGLALPRIGDMPEIVI